ncbi:hypothetical protein C0J52_08457 [Blattella germanica]|nr:hypothetical protein C0J52_08457 [Blattella germanica]
MSKTSHQLLDHENIAWVKESVWRSPKRSAKKHAMEFKHPTEVCGILHKDLKFHPYKNVTCNSVFQMEIWHYRSYITKPKAVLRDSFPGRLISRFRDVQWPDRSPAPVFFLWGYLMEKSLHHRVSKLGTGENPRCNKRSSTRDTATRWPDE